jgi:membrane-associated phospholipid phosphatase
VRTEEKLEEAEERRPSARVPLRMSRTRAWLFGTTVVSYVVIVVAVLTSSKLVTLDWQVMMFRPYKQWPQIHAFLDYFVVLGQRGPTAVMVAAWLIWRSYRQRTLRPLLVLGSSLLLLNLTVGAVKVGLGRLGPHYATTVGSPELFAGGDIFPSGHTANAVVTWGVLAYLASGPVIRRVMSVGAALLALGVGFTTIYLGTHWVSDVLLGWAAGLLILLALPWFEPAIAMAEAYAQSAWLRWRHRPATATGRSPAYPALSGSLAALADGAEAQPAFEPVPVSASASAWSGTTVSGTGSTTGIPHHPARPHTARHERTPVTPVGSRRPPADRPSRPAPLGQPVRGRGAAN